jgi:cell division protein FtsB
MPRRPTPEIRSGISTSRRRPRTRTAVLLGFAALGAMMIFTTVLGESGALHLLDLRSQHVALSERAFELLRRNEALRRQILRIGQDDRHLEAMTREKLGLVREREIVYRFPEDDEPPVPGDGPR